MMCVNETTLARSLPDCVFQHYFATILNATIIKRSLMYNVENRFSRELDPFDTIGASSLWMPEPFLQYLNGMGPNMTQSGEKVYVNLPQTAVTRLAALIENVQIPSGTFGTCDAANHTAYENYITSQLITRTIVAFGNVALIALWNPLPVGLSPANAMPTPNLLGYEIPEVIRGETLNILN